MHFIVAKVEDLSIAPIQWKNVVFEEGGFIYQLVFENEEKTKGYIHWTPKAFPMITSNIVQFTKKEDIYLLETSAASNLNRFKKILEYANPHAVVTRFKPIVRPQTIEGIFGEHLKHVSQHEKEWYVQGIMEFDKQKLSFEYSPLTGKGETSMILSRTLREEVIGKLLDLVLVKS